MVAGGGGAIFGGGAGAGDRVGAEEVCGPGEAGAVCAGRLARVGWTGGFGPKNLAQRMITPNDNREATRLLSSGVNLSFCPGALMSAPQSSEVSLQMNSLAPLPISPEPGRNQICVRADGSAAAASAQAKSRASRQIAQSPRRHIANTSARSGSFPRTKVTNTLCRTGARATRSSRLRGCANL